MWVTSTLSSYGYELLSLEIIYVKLAVGVVYIWSHPDPINFCYLNGEGGKILIVQGRWGR